VKNRSVSDRGELSECIHAAIEGLTKRTGIKVKEVQLGVGGEIITIRQGAAVIPLLDRGSKAITRRDVKKVQLQAKLLGAKMEDVVIHAFPQYYKVDDINIASNPIGLFGRKLEIKTLLIIINSTLLKNLTKAVNQAGYDVTNLFFASLSCGLASLNEYQRRQGCILLDIGATISDLLIFHEGQLKYLATIPIGGDNITKSIANRLNLSSGLSENIKKSYASAIKHEGVNEEDVLIKKEDEYLPVKKEIISQAIEPVVDQLVNTVLSDMRNSDLWDQMNAGIIMVGGGSMLSGLAERIEQNANMPVKIGRIHITGKRLQHAAKYSASVGLALTGFNQSFTFSHQPKGHANVAAHFVSKVKELYQEYF
jgi:cell division protein FtsA